MTEVDEGSAREIALKRLKARRSFKGLLITEDEIQSEVDKLR